MSLISLWQSDPQQIANKQVHQLVAYAGDGKLTDGGSCSAEFRDFLASVSTKHLKAYCDQCLNTAFTDSGFVLQDVVNQIGARLGAISVTSGRYRGTTKDVGFDGLWTFPSGHSVVIEVKTTDAYRIDLNKVAGYRESLVSQGKINSSRSSVLFVVGRQDTGDLEAQIRGSRYAWDIRLISVEALLRLLMIKEEVDDPITIKRIHDILVPREFTRLDEIAEIVFSAASDIKIEELESALTKGEDPQTVAGELSPKFEPVAFHEACIARIEAVLNTSLVKRTRTRYTSPDEAIAITCSVSKEYDGGTAPRYWFAFHPHQQVFLEDHPKAFVAYGCGNDKQLLLIPFAMFKSWLASFHMTSNADREYWHIDIGRVSQSYTMRVKKGEQQIDLSKFLLPN